MHVLLQVRDAGEDAWLGKEAPHDPVLDGPLDGDDEPLLALTAPTEQPDTSGTGAGTALGFGARPGSTKAIKVNKTS